MDEIEFVLISCHGTEAYDPKMEGIRKAQRIERYVQWFENVGHEDTTFAEKVDSKDFDRISRIEKLTEIRRGLPHRRHLHRRPGAAPRRGPEGGEDLGLRFADEPSASRSANAPDRQLARPNFWSVRVNADVRIIVHKTEASLLLAYVDHHDRAYAWAARRRIEAHPKTGAVQIVEVRERVEDIAPPPSTPTRAKHARRREPPVRQVVGRRTSLAGRAGRLAWRRARGERRRLPRTRASPAG